VWIPALVVAAAPVLAISIGGSALWGGDAYAFLPRAALWLGLGATAALAFLATRRTPAPGGAPPGLPGAPANARAALGTTLLLLAAGFVFWTFRIRHVLLGDGIPITATLPDTHELHPREPLASLIQQVLYRVLAPVFARPGVPREHLVQDCVALGSVISGVVFVAVARALGREVVRSLPAREPENERWLAWALTLAFLAQGYVQLFFGYVENYSYFAVVAGLYVLAALQFLRGAAPLAAPLGALVLGLALHFTAIVLAPSALVLVVAGLLDRARRPAVARDLLLVTLIAAGIIAALGLGPWHFPVASNLAAMLASGRAGADYLFSAAHVRDFFNEHLLLGPFGLLLFIPAAVLLPWKTARPPASLAFLLVAGLSVAAACWSAPDLPLGYARDWDLYAPLGVVLAVSAIALTMALSASAAARWRAAALIVVVSLFHTVPWVALNTSEPRSLERFKTLPLGEGRTESTVAFWYAQRGDFAEAKRWLTLSLTVNPGNHRAVDLFGRIALAEHQPRRAVQSYLLAAALRPDKVEYRRQLAIALRAAGGPAEGLATLDSLMIGHEQAGALWLERAMLLRACGREVESAEAKARALQLRPDLASQADAVLRTLEDAPAPERRAP